MTHLVYFLGKSSFNDNQPDFVKIGYTGGPVQRRINQLQSGNEAEIREIGVIRFETEDEARAEERQIHSRFAAFSARGEWFYATTRIKEYIRDHSDELSDASSQQEALDAAPSQPEVPGPNPSFGQQLAARRNEAGLTQAELASRVDCSPGAISLIETNRIPPSQRLRERLVEVFGEFVEPTTNLLAVQMADGTRISADTAMNTFIEVIEAIGIERVKDLGLKVNGIPLVSEQESPEKAQRRVETEAGTYYVVSGTNTVRKQEILERIAEGLELSMQIFANPRA